MKLERRELLDKLVLYGQMLEKLSSEDEAMRMEIKFLDHHVTDANREDQIARENRQRYGLRRVEVLAYRKRIAKRLSQTKDTIERTRQNRNYQD